MAAEEEVIETVLSDNEDMTPDKPAFIPDKPALFKSLLHKANQFSNQFRFGIHGHRAT